MKNTQIIHFGPKFRGIFVFPQNFAIRQMRGCWFQIWQYCLQIPALQYINQAFLVPNLGIFAFSWKFANRQIPRCWFQIWQQFFQNSSPKISKEGILGPKFWHFHFFSKFIKLDKFEGADFKYVNSFLKF